MKALLWMGSSKADLLMFPSDARRNAGFQLRKVQRGADPSDWKVMPTIGVGVREIRLREDSGAFRVIYLASRAEGIYVLHCFQKKSEATSRQNIELARKRLKAIPKVK